MAQPCTFLPGFGFLTVAWALKVKLLKKKVLKIKVVKVIKLNLKMNE